MLTATGSYTDGSSQDLTASVTWTVDNATIAQILSGGQAIPAMVGSTGIEATLNGITGNETLVVQPIALSAYFTNNVPLPDTTVRISNPGIDGNSLCAMVYVFDQNQQMAECCGCVISPDGLRTLSVQKDLNDNPLTGVRSTTGSLMIVPADYSSTSSCDASSMTPDGLSVAWATHLQATSQSKYSISETPFSATPLNDTLSSALQAQCQFIQQLGSGQGICRCGTGD
jgi:hypothetical protein